MPLLTEPYPINPIEAEQVLEACLLTQLSFCIRWALKPEIDYQKIAVLRSNMQIEPKGDKERLMYKCIIAMQADKQVAMAAYGRIPPQYRDAIFLACSRIVSLKGFEEDINGLVRLRTSLSIDAYKADLMIELAKNEAELIRMAG